MSDQTYVNYYIENVVGVAHEYLNTILQLKTQLRIATEAVSEKDILISSLQSEIESLRNNNLTLNDIVSKSVHDAISMEGQLHGLQNKVSHMDTLLAQVSDMKRIIKEKDAELEVLRRPIINNKKKPVVAANIVEPPEMLQQKADEDF